MDKKIALLLESKKEPELNRIEQAVVFNMEDDRVVGVENEKMESKEVNDLMLWAQKKQVDEIFTPYADDQLRLFFKKLGINLRAYDELSEDPLFRTFIFG